MEIKEAKEKAREMKIEAILALIKLIAAVIVWCFAVRKTKKLEANAVDGVFEEAEATIG